MTDFHLQANILTGVGGGARFQLELGGTPVRNYTLAESVLLRGNWIKGLVGWGDTTDDPDNGRRAVLTPWYKDFGIISIRSISEGTRTSTRCTPLNAPCVALCVVPIPIGC